VQEARSKESLNRAVRAIRAGKTTQRAFTRYPSLEAASRRLVEYLTERFPGRGGPLVHECLRSACRAFEDAQGDERERLDYLAGLVREAAQLTCKRVGVGDVFWVPFTESFSVFLERMAGRCGQVELALVDEPAPGEIRPYLAAMMLAVRIMPAADASEVCEAYWKADVPATAHAETAR
jgi:hypothetical protein